MGGVFRSGPQQRRGAALCCRPVRLPVIALLVAAVAFAGAHAARRQAKQEGRAELVDRPFAPSPTVAPIMTLGYRELAADLLFARMIGYWGSPDNEAAAIADLAEAIVALDPQFRRV